MSENQDGFFRKNRDLVVYAALSALVMAVYWQTTGAAFINFDDNLYVYANPMVAAGLTGDTVKWAFTAFHSANWHPVTWLSHALDVRLFGMNPGAHHATNIVLHLINSILAFAVFRRLTGCFWKSAIVAALFAVHPTHVESVAWVSERKDLLSTAFWLLTMLAYVRWAESGKDPDAGEEDLTSRILVRYVPVVVFFALGLMSKPMLVTLPFVLLLLDFWPLGRLRSAGDLRQLVIEKIPLFVLSGISSYVTILAQKSGGAIQTAEAIPLDARLFNAIVAYAKYVWMMFYPAGLAVWYPYDKQLPVWQIAASLLFLALVTTAVWLLRSSKPYLLFGWLWFLGTLVPVIGLVQVGEQQMADRYTYVPYFGLFVMIVWGIGDLSKRLGVSGRAVLVPAVAVVLVLTFLAHRQAAFWKDEETLYRHSLSVTKDAFLPMHNLCHSLMLKDRLDEAEPLCLESVRIRPDWRESHNTLGIIRTKQARYSEAVGFFEKSLTISPGDAIVNANLAVAHSLAGDPERAEESLKNVRQDALTPDNWSSAFDTLGSAYLAKNNFEKALEFLGLSVSIRQDKPDTRSRLALTLYELKKYDEAQTQILESLRQKPDAAEARNIYGKILVAMDQRSEAVRQFEQALALKPDFAEARTNLEKAR